MVISNSIDLVSPSPGGDNTDGRQSGGGGSRRRDPVEVQHHLVETLVKCASEGKKTKAKWFDRKRVILSHSHQRPLQSRKITKKETSTRKHSTSRKSIFSNQIHRKFLSLSRILTFSPCSPPQGGADVQSQCAKVQKQLDNNITEHKLSFFLLQRSP